MLKFLHHPLHPQIVLYNRPRPLLFMSASTFCIYTQTKQRIVQLFAHFSFTHEYPRLEQNLLIGWTTCHLFSSVGSQCLFRPYTNPTSSPRAKEIRLLPSDAVVQISIAYCLASLQDKTNSNSHQSFFLHSRRGGGIFQLT